MKTVEKVKEPKFRCVTAQLLGKGDDNVVAWNRFESPVIPKGDAPLTLEERFTELLKCPRFRAYMDRMLRETDDILENLT